MKRSIYHQIIGALVCAGRNDLADKIKGEISDEVKEKLLSPEMDDTQPIVQAEDAKNPSVKGIVVDIETDTKGNDNFRKVLYTGKNTQLVLMSLKAKEDIGEEVHNNVDQFFRIDEGNGKVIINGVEHPLKDGSAFIIPQGSKHNVIAGEKGLKLYSLYSPPNHKDGTIHKTKEEAKEEHYDGKTTETIV